VIKKYRQNDTRNALLEEREKKLIEAERNLKIATLEFKLGSERDKTQFSKDIALGLVRNTEYRKHIYDSEQQTGYYDGTGRWIQPSPINKSLEEKGSAH